MEEKKYTTAGLAAFGSAVTFLVTTGILIYHDVLYTPALGGGGNGHETVFLAIAFDVVSTLLGIFALIKFRQLLQERYDFHAVDDIILILILGGVVLGGLSYAGRLIDQNLPIMLTGAVMAVAMGVIGIVFALRLLKLPGTLNGYLKPLAYTELIASICFAVVLLAPIALIMLIVFNILLGLVFFSSDSSLEEVDFV